MIDGEMVYMKNNQACKIVGIVSVSSKLTDNCKKFNTKEHKINKEKYKNFKITPPNLIL